MSDSLVHTRYLLIDWLWFMYLSTILVVHTHWMCLGFSGTKSPLEKWGEVEFSQKSDVMQTMPAVTKPHIAKPGCWHNMYLGKILESRWACLGRGPGFQHKFSAYRLPGRQLKVSRIKLRLTDSVGQFCTLVALMMPFHHYFPCLLVVMGGGAMSFCDQSETWPTESVHDIFI